MCTPDRTKYYDRLIAFALILLVPFLAGAQDSSLEQKLKEGTNHYDNLNLEKAKEVLTTGIQQASRNGIENKTVAELYLMLGIVEYAKNRDDQAVLTAFKRALAIDYSVQIDPFYRTPKLKRLFEKAKDSIERVDYQSAYSHRPVSTAESNKPLEIKATLSEGRDNTEVYLYYRSRMEIDYHRAKMQWGLQNPDVASSSIPARRVKPKGMEYYIEVVGKGGKRLAGTGTASDPIKIDIKGPEPEKQKRAAGSKEPKVKQNKKQDKTETSDKEAEKEVSDRFRENYFVSVGGGAGAGYLMGGKPTGYPERTISPGIAPTFAHLLIEGGVPLTDKMDLGFYFRWQFLPTQNFARVPLESQSGSFPVTTKKQCFGLGFRGDCLFGIKLRRDLFLAGSFDVYGHGGLGIGRIRDWVRLKEEPDSKNCEDKQRYQASNGQRFCYLRDTVRPGWFHVGGGMGAILPLTEAIGLEAETYLMLIVPDTAIHIDLNLNFEYQF